jgi:hypothetical protein
MELNQTKHNHYSKKIPKKSQVDLTKALFPYFPSGSFLEMIIGNPKCGSAQFLLLSFPRQNIQTLESIISNAGAVEFIRW